MKRILLPLSLLLLTSTAWAQSVTLQADKAKPTTDIYGDLPVCMGPVNVEAVSCDADGAIKTSVAAPTTAATFGAQTTITAATLDSTYRTIVDLADGTKAFTVDNQTNGDVQISLDGGTTDHLHVKAGSSVTYNLAEKGLVTTAVIQAKDGTTASTSGSVYVYSVK